MKTTTKPIYTVALLLFLLLITSSCSKIALVGYGVVLWGGEKFSLSPGTIVEIHSQSSFDHMYTISTIEDDLEYTVKKGFIAKFDNKKKAVDFKKEYERYIDSYAVAEVNGLRIRQKPGIDGSLVYKLRKGEEVKFVDKVKVNGKNEAVTGRWYRVVTANGYEGFSYGKYLSLKTGKEKIEHETTTDLYTKLRERFFSSKWRPEYMKRMVAEGKINLERFDPDIGLFPKEEEKKIRIKTIKSTYTFSIENSKVSPPKTLIFSGGDVKVRFHEKNRIMVEYEGRSSVVREHYVELDVPVEKTIEAVRQRRKERYMRFIEKGTRYASSYYGVLHFEDDFKVTWRSRGNVPEQILPSEAGEAGRLEFSVFLNQELKETYGGAFSLVFPFADREHEITFVYERTQNGLRLIYIPEDLIVKNEVSSLPPSSKLIMFFYNQNT